MDRVHVFPTTQDTAKTKGHYLPSSALLAGLAYMAFKGKPLSPGIGKLEIPNVYISFSPLLREEHWQKRKQQLKESV